MLILHPKHVITSTMHMLLHFAIFLRTDGEYSTQEQEWLSDINHLRLEGGLPEEVKCRLMAIAENDTITFDDVKAYLDKVSIRSLDSIADSVHLAINLDDEVSREEQCAEMEFKKYMISQMEASCWSQNSYGGEVIQELINDKVVRSIDIKKEFADCTKLQGFDLAFLAVATFLQVARVLIINAVTQIETAGQGNQKEKALHDLQNKLLKNFDETSNQSSFLYASTQHIISARGVPYRCDRRWTWIIQGRKSSFFDTWPRSATWNDLWYFKYHYKHYYVYRKNRLWSKYPFDVCSRIRS